ncbi:MAG: hypothetical protein AB7J30_00300 [Hyphomicrobium sp.]|uniref:hypothetical protein n=1 Tax=Hyphomicrobium sp. TaxID=82 RepID=UPI003D0A2254
MSEKSLPSFRSIVAPLDVDDAALDRINLQLGVPTLTKPTANVKSQQKAKSLSPAPGTEDVARAPLEKLTIEVPAYLADAMKRMALDRRMSVRHVVMLALKKTGFEIETADLVADGRRRKKKSQ